jgi:hypothetical protein
MQKYRIELCSAMASEIQKYLVGPMPPDQFLEDFFPLNKLDDRNKVPSFSAGCYDQTVNALCETHAYAPFVSFSSEIASTLAHNGPF